MNKTRNEFVRNVCDICKSTNTEDCYIKRRMDGEFDCCNKKIKGMIIAVAIKTKDNEIFVSRNSHSEILMMYPEKFKNAEQGFLTSECEFVNRQDALKIAKQYNQIICKLVDNDELYSEDLFLKRK